MPKIKRRFNRRNFTIFIAEKCMEEVKYNLFYPIAEELGIGDFVMKNVIFPITSRHISPMIPAMCLIDPNLNTSSIRTRLFGYTDNQNIDSSLIIHPFYAVNVLTVMFDKSDIPFYNRKTKQYNIQLFIWRFTSLFYSTLGAIYNLRVLPEDSIFHRYKTDIIFDDDNMHYILEKFRNVIDEISMKITYRIQCNYYLNDDTNDNIEYYIFDNDYIEYLTLHDDENTWNTLQYQVFYYEMISDIVSYIFPKLCASNMYSIVYPSILSCTLDLKNYHTIVLM